MSKLSPPSQVTSAFQNFSLSISFSISLSENLQFMRHAQVVYQACLLAREGELFLKVSFGCDGHGFKASTESHSHTGRISIYLEVVSLHSRCVVLPLERRGEVSLLCAECTQQSSKSESVIVGQDAVSDPVNNGEWVKMLNLNEIYIITHLILQCCAFLTLHRTTRCCADRMLVSARA